MKHYKLALVVLLSIVTLVSCQKESIDEEINTRTNFKQNNSEQDDLKTVTHQYEYYGEKFKITYQYNTKTNEMVNIEGDKKAARNIIANGSENLAFLYEYKNDQSLDVFNVKIFDSREGLLRYIQPNKKANAMKNNDCVDRESYGHADYLFYDGTQLSGQLLYHGSNKDEYAIQYLYGANDRISSLTAQTLLSNVTLEVVIYEHSCYTGISHTFTQPSNMGAMHIRDLRNLTLSGWWIFSTSWDNQISSFEGDVY